MINCITCKTAHLFGRALSSQYELRYKTFLKFQNWDLSEWEGMEYDIYDTPATTYLVWQDIDGIVRGTSRLLPTDRPYMIQDMWPDSIDKIPLPNSIKIWEGSRFCVDSSTSRQVRRIIVKEIICAYLEYAIMHDIEAIIGMMPTSIWQSVFIRNGWNVEFLGKEKPYGGGRNNRAGLLHISEEILENVRMTTNIKHPVLITSPFNSEYNYKEYIA